MAVSLSQRCAYLLAAPAAHFLLLLLFLLLLFLLLLFLLLLSSSFSSSFSSSSSFFLLPLLLLLLLFAPAPAQAQLASSGFELALHGRSDVVAGKSARFRGVAYRVRGVSELQPLAGARLRARYSTRLLNTGSWTELRADASGFFQVDVPMPANPTGASQLEMSVGDGTNQRVFAFPLRFASPLHVDLVTDRALYEPGEIVHVWTRLRDSESRRPIAGSSVAFTFDAIGIKDQQHKTGESGVASTKVVIPKETKEGRYEVVAHIAGRDIRQNFSVGTRSYERLFADIKIAPERASPHQEVSAIITVTTASGARVRNAKVKVVLDSQAEYHAHTDAQGHARVVMRAPAYMKHATGSVPIWVKVNHAAHGEADAFSTLGLEVPLTLEVEAVPSNGALVPGLPGLLYVRLSMGKDKPAPLGTPIEVHGAAIRGGKARGKTDRHGFVAIPTSLPAGAATGDEHQAMTTVFVHVEGEAPRTASLEIAVMPESEVVPTVDKLVVAPGEAISIRLLRRPSAARVPVIVELLSETGLVEAHKLSPGVNRLSMQAPGDRLGVMSVRARPLHQKSVGEGTGGVDAFLVRPPNPSFPSLVADKKVYAVGTTANLSLRTAPGPGKSWAAVLVRDIAAHNGEIPFRRYFLARAFDKAILDTKTASADMLFRAALANYLYVDPKPIEAPPLLDALGEEAPEGYGLGSSSSRGVLRDPFPLADELKRRGIGQVMRRIEELLSEALMDGRLSDLVTRRNGRSQFKAILFDEFEDHPLSLGEGDLSLEMLYAADPSFSYDNVGRRVARRRLIELLVALSVYLDPGDEASPQQRAAAREPSDRWLSRMVERGLISAEQLTDPWGNSFVLRSARKPVLAIAIEASNLELVSPGPDGKFGTRDDIADPFARAVPAGTTYALASGEDRLMAQLARLAPGAEVLRRLLEAYQRVTAEVAEEEIGDAVGALMGEGYGSIGTGSYGTIGHGSGSGSGYGSGSGRGGIAGRSARAPSVRVGSASAGGIGGFSKVVRERFPSTLFFAPAIAVSPSGTTTIAVPLSEAITTHLVEVIVWSADGWTWSAETKIRVDRETVIDAPVPSYATVGDVVRLPVRIGNRSSKSQTFEVAVFTPDKMETALFRRSGVVVPGKDTVVEVVDLKLERAMKGTITVGLRSAKGAALDAVRRPIEVQASTRRVRRVAEMLAGASKAGTDADTLRLSIPTQASRREGSQVRIRVGPGLFDLPKETPHLEWARAWRGRVDVSRETVLTLRSGHSAPLAVAVGVAWRNPNVSDETVAAALRRLTSFAADLEKIEVPETRVHSQAQLLLGLAPATRALRARRPLDAELQAILRNLRKQVQAASVHLSESPRLWAMSAAALALTAPSKAKQARVSELVRRVRRHQLVVGPHTWIAAKDGVHETSAYLALAELSLGERKRALSLLRTLATLTLSKRSVSPWARVLARVAAQLASPGGVPDFVNLHIDGVVQRVPLEGGDARVPAPGLSLPGEHAISVDTGASAPALYHLEALSEHGLPWGVVPERPGSIVAAIQGEIGRVGEKSKLELLLRNRSPRTIARPIVEISLPAGAELDEKSKRSLRRHTRGDSEATRGTLRLQLPGLAPGATKKIPITFRWAIGGKLHGLGLASFPADNPEDVSIVQPRLLDIAAARVSP